MEEFNSILQKVSPIWKSKILGKYKCPGRSFTISRIIKKLEPLLAKAIPLPKERLLSKEEAMCLIDATEQSIERPNTNISMLFMSESRSIYSRL